jgi:hypothetical protein
MSHFDIDISACFGKSLKAFLKVGKVIRTVAFFMMRLNKHDLNQLLY